jgi:hypothetical protein
MILLLASTPARSEGALPTVSGDTVWHALDEAALLASLPDRWIVPQAYLLVVPLSADREKSYGTDSALFERS